MPENRNHGIHLVALQGSVRPGNNTAKALALVADEIQKHPGISLEIVDPTTMHLPLPGQGTSEDAKRMQQLVAVADGIILATPEYHGSYSSVMKLLIDNLGFPSALSGKPVALLGVAAGRIGAIKALDTCVASPPTSAPRCCQGPSRWQACGRSSMEKDGCWTKTLPPWSVAWRPP